MNSNRVARLFRKNQKKQLVKTVGAIEAQQEKPKQFKAKIGIFILT
jgi:hypothetical protein